MCYIINEHILLIVTFLIYNIIFIIYHKHNQYTFLILNCNIKEAKKSSTEVCNNIPTSSNCGESEKVVYDVQKNWKCVSTYFIIQFANNLFYITKYMHYFIVIIIFVIHQVVNLIK